MAVYRLSNRTFSRLWRRSKDYSDHEIRWLARRRGLEMRAQKGSITVSDPKQANKIVASFQEVAQSESIRSNNRMSMQAALRLGLYLLFVYSSMAQTYEEKVVASVLMGESWSEGTRGMTAVAEVISQRSKDLHKTPLQVTTAHVGRIHAFSCMNGTTAERMVLKYQREPQFSTALRIAMVACRTPDKLPGITNRATHFTRSTEKPWWAKKKKAVAVIGSHSFYRMARY